MPKLKPVTILPTPEEDVAIITAALADPDAQPYTDEEWQQARHTVRRGRPLGSGHKKQVTLRLDVDLVERLKSTGPGWQTRANDALRKWLLGYT